MSDAAQTLALLLREDKRYQRPAYLFVFDALNYAHSELGMGGAPSSGEQEDNPATTDRHLTGQELCEAIRLYALDQYGYMAKCVLNSYGVHTTGDFGEIVFNLIRVGLMRKTDDDRREDFDDVFDFETGLQKSFQITPPE
ncbi:MAG TPA: Minf_1886 family protein [Pirellulales bacterium]|nr:Minf_1886 family protein [Pirellulales bacterium]